METKMKVKVLPVNVYRWTLGDCTNGGISGRFDSLYLICDQGWLEVELNDPRLIKIVTRNHVGREGTYTHVEPVNDPDKKEIGYMAGGNFVYSCDSRFPFDYPLPIHDRSETQEQYDTLSR